jgi:secretion/DNA translocation related TadE-like protein
VSSADRGSASLYVLATASLLVASSLAALVVASLFLAHRRAAAAADLAALAGAAAVDPLHACPVASAVAAANGGQVKSCRVEPDGDVVVAVSRSAGAWFPPVVVWARAGQPVVSAGA